MLRPQDKEIKEYTDEARSSIPSQSAELPASPNPHDYSLSHLLIAVLASIIISLTCVLPAQAVQYQQGDIAPRGAPDGVVNVADLYLLQKIVTGDLAIQGDELAIADVAPAGGDGVLNVSDVYILQKALMGEVTLGTVIVPPEKPDIDPLPVVTNQNPVTVTGQASPGILVRVYSNDIERGVVTADAVTGAFSVDILLDEGDNDVYALADDGETLSDESDHVNSRLEYIVITGGAIGSTVFDAATSYRVDASIQILQGETITIEAGARLYFQDGAGLEIDGDSSSDAGLVINGTSERPVLLTSYSGVIGSWEGIKFERDSTGQIDYAIIEFAKNGIYYNSYNSDRNTPLELQTVTNSVIRDNNVGIFIYTYAHPVIDGNKIFDNGIGIKIGAQSQLNPAAKPRPVINNNSIYANALHNIYTYRTRGGSSTSDNIINARNNWWGTADLLVLGSTVYDYSDPNDYNIDNPAETYSSQLRAVLDVSGYLDAENGSPLYEVLPSLISADLSYVGEVIYVYTDVLVDRDVTLTLNDGVELRFLGGGGLTIESGIAGSQNIGLQVTGAPQSPVIMTSDVNEPGAWRGLEIRSKAITDLSYLKVEYAEVGINYNGSDSSDNFAHSADSIEVVNNTIGVINRGHSPITINNSTIAHNSFWNILSESVVGSLSKPPLNMQNIWWGSADPRVIERGIFDAFDSSGSGFRKIDYSYPLDAPNGSPLPVYVWQKLDSSVVFANEAYIIGDIDFEPGFAPVITDSVTFLIFEDTLITVNTDVDFSGQPGHRVSFVPANISSQNNIWEGIYVASGGSLDLSQCYISHAKLALHYESSSGQINNCILTNNERAMFIEGDSNVAVIDSVINSNDYGIEIDGEGLPVGQEPVVSLINNSIFDNQQYDLRLRRIEVGYEAFITLNNNWWGTDDQTAIESAIQLNFAGAVDKGLLISNRSVTSLRPVITSISASDQYFSPVTSPGIKDRAVYAATLNQSASTTIEVFDGQNTLVRSYSPTGTSFQIEWDGNDQAGLMSPDGCYQMRILLDGVMSGFSPYCLDNMLPNASISTIDNIPSSVHTLSVRGDARDANVSIYEVSYAPAASPTSWIPLQSFSSKEVDEGELGLWIVGSSDGSIPPIPNGDYIVRLSVEDLAGNTSIAQLNYTLQKLYIWDVRNNVTTIEPLASDTVAIDFNLTSASDVEFVISNEADGSIVYSDVKAFQAGPAQFSWDGISTQGNVVPDEAYLYSLRAFDANEEYVFDFGETPDDGFIEVVPNVGSFNVDYSVQRNIAWSNYLDNKVTARVTMCVRRDGSASGACNVSNPFSNPDNRYAFKDVPIEASQSYYYWDGRDEAGEPIDNTDYSYYYPPPVQLPDNTIIVTGTKPSIRGVNAPEVSVQSDPYQISYSYDQYSSIKFTVSQDVDVIVKLLPPGIFDPDDASAVTILSDSLSSRNGSGQLIEHEFQVHGYDYESATADTNLLYLGAIGDHTFTIRAVNPVTGFETLYRGSLTLNQ